MPFSCVLIFWLCHQIWILILLSPYHQTCRNKQFLYSSSFFLASVGVGWCILFLNVFCCCILSILCSRISVYCVLSWSHELWAVPTFSVLLFSSVFPRHFVCFIFLFISSLHTEYSTPCCIAMASVAPACLS